MAKFRGGGRFVSCSGLRAWPCRSAVEKLLADVSVLVGLGELDGQTDEGDSA